METVALKNYLAEIVQYLGHHYPLYSGCGKLSNLKLLRWLLADQKRETIWATLKDKSNILAPRHDWIGHSLYYFGDLDPKLTWLCKKLLRKGDTVIDIGANIGLVSLISSKIIGEEGIIHAFEPQPRLVSMFRESIKANMIKNITIHNCALGEEEATMNLFVPTTNSGAASLVQRAYEEGESIEVPVVDGAHYLSKLALSKIRLIKMDVEGYEATVLRGAYSFLKETKPDAIIFEVLDHHTPFADLEVVQILQSLNYRFYDMKNPLVGVKLRELDLSETLTEYGHDIVALQDDIL